MKLQTLIGLGGLAGAMMISNEASASYFGLGVQYYTTVNAGGQLRSVYRIYANFTSANDYLTAVFGSPTAGELTIQNCNTLGTGLGSGFFNPGGFSGNTAPFQSQIDANPDLQWGTFATIGVSIADTGSGVPPANPDETGLSPGFPNFINGNQLVNNNMGWFTPGPVEQGRAGYAGDGDPLLRVLMMQLTVNAGEGVQGTVDVAGVNAGSGSFVIGGQTFVCIPAPGAGALLALAGIAGAGGGRRRRARH